MTSFHPSTRRTRQSSIVRNAFVLNGDNLGHRVVSGASFTFLGIALRTFLTLGSVAVLARLLSPADFGYVAMATVITEFAGLFGGFGFSNILIQSRVINRLQIDTVFWASALIGITLALVVFSLSFLTGWLFTDAIVGNLLRFLCINFVFGSLINVHEAMLARLMRFQTDFWIQISTIAFRGLVAIVFAYLGFGVWSLIAGSLAGSFAALILMNLAVPYRPRLRFHREYLSSTWKTSSSYFGNGILYYMNMNVDLLLIGRQLGANALGYYQNARSLTDEVRGRIAMPLQRVLFPAFSAIQMDNARLQYSFMRSARLLAAIICPVGFGLAAVSEDIVPVLYGQQWLAMMPILSMLGISAAFRGSTAIAFPLFNAKNRVELALKFNIIGTALMVTSVVLALPYGLKTVATVIAANSLYSLVTFWVGLGLIGLNIKHIVQIFAAPVAASLVMWAAIAAIRLMITGLWTYPELRLLLHIVAGALTYILTLCLFDRQYLLDFKELANKFLGKS